MDVLFSQLFAGLSLGSVLLLAALGLALTFGQMGVINMAHGEFMMAGAYTAYVVQGIVSNAGVSLMISLVVGFLVGGTLGLVLEMTLIHRMYRRPLDTLLVTWGVALVLQQAARNIFGAPNVDVRAPSGSGAPSASPASTCHAPDSSSSRSPSCASSHSRSSSSSRPSAAASAPSCRTATSPRRAASRRKPPTA